MTAHNMTDAHVHLNIIPAAVQPLHPNTSTFLSTATPTEKSHITNTLQHAAANHNALQHQQRPL